MKSHLLITLCLCLPAMARDGQFIMPATAPSAAKSTPGKVITADELKRKWSSGESRSFNAPPAQKRVTLVSDKHLAALKAAGATRGISVVAVGGGQSQVTCQVNPESAVTFQNILFKINSTELADQSSVRQINEIAQAIKGSGGKGLVLEGHTCDLGTDEYNLGLSERRAAAIQALLIARGVHPAQLVPLGFGESEPALPNTSEANREDNRRVVISLLE